MPSLALSPIGLSLAATMSVTNVLTDVARKRALDRRDLVPATFWIRTAVTAVFGLVLLWRITGGFAPVIRDGGALFGIACMHLAPLPTFLIYLLINVILITVVVWLYFRALQVSPLSLCVPFLAFTPVFLIPNGFVLLGELPPPLKLLGGCCGVLILYLPLTAAQAAGVVALTLAGMAAALYATRNRVEAPAPEAAHTR